MPELTENSKETLAKKEELKGLKTIILPVSESEKAKALREIRKRFEPLSKKMGNKLGGPMWKGEVNERTNRTRP